MNSNKRRGLVHIYTGEGKGKTTAALGMALRAAGQGMKVIFIQFVKGGSLGGEHLFVEKYKPFEIIQLNKKSSFLQTPDELRREAEKTMKFAEEVVLTSKYDMVILDEICFALSQEVLPLSRVLNLIKNKPESVELILTGRGAPQELIEEADYVTRMEEVKHPFEKGINSRKGIEY